MKMMKRRGEKGTAGHKLLWFLAVPFPILLLFFLLRGCS